eukprot:CAMPEP_0194280044 /NCGR_PEP_ID=MMETSP0169-20130528/15382_1 /TAXON_ID=218684 /ORGANISM="Corethron pennatum, Strain L29A3" /LENGTH=391 /DNA_ID=CAMNT_0039024615 /DNA_START=116 /DNA_END=1288 /DNA_ORIENTATION=+
MVAARLSSKRNSAGDTVTESPVQENGSKEIDPEKELVADVAASECKDASSPKKTKHESAIDASEIVSPTVVVDKATSENMTSKEIAEDVTVAGDADAPPAPMAAAAEAVEATEKAPALGEVSASTVPVTEITPAAPVAPKPATTLSPPPSTVPSAAPAPHSTASMDPPAQPSDMAPSPSAPSHSAASPSVPSPSPSPSAPSTSAPSPSDPTSGNPSPIDSTPASSSPPQTGIADPNPGGPPDENITISDTLSPSYVGRVIGKGGEMIRDLQARAGCRIDVDQSVPQGHPRLVTYRGKRSQVDFGRRLVSMLCTEGGRDVPLPLGEASRRDIWVPANVIGKVIGRGGEMIRELQARSQAKIQVDHSVLQDGQRKITITGGAQAVDRAALMVD